VSETSARDAILRLLRAARPAALPAPDVTAALRGFPKSSGDLTARFTAAARAVSADLAEGRRDELSGVVTAVAPGAVRILSTVVGVTGTVDLPGDPRALVDLDLLVCEAVLGVAENGAVWLPTSRLGSHAAAFLAEHVIVLLDRAAIVADLHEAYARLDVHAEPFGVFVAGPSKTADIEQSLVIGAHGPKQLTIFLVHPD
jgi:L-lactate dehydrogenase complex protein LldG